MATGIRGTAGDEVITAGVAMEVVATTGDLAGHIFLVVAGDNDGIYLAGNDYVFDISGLTGTIDTGDFI